MESLKSNRGVSIIYVMGALLVVGFIGISMVKMAFTDQKVDILYSSSESARISAKSGITATIASISSDNSDTLTKYLKILNNYIAAANPDTLPDSLIWLQGGPNSWDTLSNNQFYRVRLNGFNRDNFEISLVSDGIGMGKSRATVVALYSIKGLKYRVINSTIPTNALQIDNGAFEFDAPVVINGNTSIKKGSKIWDPAYFHGHLRLDTLVRSNGTKEIGAITFSGGPLKVDSSAYFAGEIGGSGATAYFYNSAAFDGIFYFQNANVHFDTTANSKYVFAGGTNDAGCGKEYDMENNMLEVYDNTKTYKPHNDITSFIHYSNVWNSISNSVVSLPERIGMSSTPPPPIYFDTTVLNSVAYPVIDANAGQFNNNSGRLTGDSLNKYYALSAGNRLNGFAVLRVKNKASSGKIFYDDGSEFNGKMILWLDHSDNLYQFVNTTTTANLTLYLNDGATETHFTGFNYMRGYIYCNKYSGGTHLSFGGSDNLEVVGGIYATENASIWLYGGGVKTVTYDPTVIAELATTGVFNNPNDTTGSGTSTNTVVLDENYPHLEAELLSQAF